MGGSRCDQPFCSPARPTGRPMTVMQAGRFPAEVIDYVVRCCCRIGVSISDCWSDDVPPLRCCSSARKRHRDAFRRPQYRFRGPDQQGGVSRHRNGGGANTAFRLISGPCHPASGPRKTRTHQLSPSATPPFFADAAFAKPTATQALAAFFGGFGKAGPPICCRFVGSRLEPGGTRECWQSAKMAWRCRQAALQGGGPAASAAHAVRRPLHRPSVGPAGPTDIAIRPSRRAGRRWRGAPSHRERAERIPPINEAAADAHDAAGKREAAALDGTRSGPSPS